MTTRTRYRSLLWTLALASSGCAGDITIEPNPSDPLTSGDTPIDSPKTTDCINTKLGRRCFIDKDGLAITGGDIILGEVEAVRHLARQQTSGITSLYSY